MHGVNGRILRVDLTDARTEVLDLPEALYQTYVGGKAMAAELLLNELHAGVDPLSPQNVLVFASGPLTGFPVSGQGRNGVASKSPLTSGFGSSEAGGYWGAELKRAGFDAVTVSGRAERPVYLWIKDGRAEIRDAAQLWGKATSDALTLIQEETGEPRVRVAAIGPAGERLIRYANIANDLIHFAGRGGLGAVMGSKNLKAVAVRGSGRGPTMADSDRVRSLARWMTENDKEWGGLRDLGTPGSILGSAYVGNLPTRNFSTPPSPDDAAAISGEKLRDTALVGSDTCYACVVKCKRVVEVHSTRFSVNPTYGGPEYENVGAFGSCCGIYDLEAVLKANEMVNSNGLDAISAGVAIAFAMECYEHGLISQRDAGGVDLRFGNAEGMLSVLHSIIERRGLGDLLAEGVARAAASIPGSELFAMHVKGEEIPMHEPRFRHGQGVGFAISPNGPDHMANMYDDSYTSPESPSLTQLNVFADLKPSPVDGLGEDKMRILFYRSNWQHFLDCAVLCHFMPYGPEQLTLLFNAVTGWDVSARDLLAVGERASTLARIFNLREGLDTRQDTLPGRFFEPFSSGPLAGKAPQRDEFRAAVECYYRLSGWTPKDGQPTDKRLRELGIEWAESKLPTKNR